MYLCCKLILKFQLNPIKKNPDTYTGTKIHAQAERTKTLLPIRVKINKNKVRILKLQKL